MKITFKIFPQKALRVCGSVRTLRGEKFVVSDLPVAGRKAREVKEEFGPAYLTWAEKVKTVQEGASKARGG